MGRGAVERPKEPLGGKRSQGLRRRPRGPLRPWAVTFRVQNIPRGLAHKS